MRICIAILILTFIHAKSSAQKGVENWAEGRLKAGFLIAHRGSMGHMAQEHAYAIEFSYMIQPHGEKKWHSRFRDPLYGFTFFSGTVGSKEYLGTYFGAYSFIQFPFIKYKGYTLSGKMGTGVGYGSKVFDPESNKLNIAISTHFNAQICLGLNSRFVFGNNAISVAADLTHFSNGSTKIPNLGINVPYLSLAYSRKLSEANSIEREEKFDLPLRRFEYGALVIGSVQEVVPGFDHKRAVFGLNLITRYFFGGKSGIEASFDVFSKQSIMDYHPDVEKSQLDIIQLGFYCGYIIPLDRIHVLVGMGAYVRDKYRPADAMYHRLGIRYVMPNGINLNLALKSHWARADYIEYGIGYTFRK